MVRWERSLGGAARVAAAVWILSGCASGPPPAPGPILAEPPSDPPADPAFGWSLPLPEVQPEWPLPRPVPTPSPPPALPWIAPTLVIEPGDPAEGSVVAIRLVRAPGSRRPGAIEGVLDGRPLAFRPTREGWMALAGLPVESAGERLLTLRFRLGPEPDVEWTEPLEVRSRVWPSARLRVAARTDSPNPAVQERLERDRERIRSTIQEVTPVWLAGEGFQWPRRDRITSPFGQRRMFAGQVRAWHLGLDVAGRTGEPVRTAARGRVALTGDFLLQGRAVYVDHGLGVVTGYFHLSRIDVHEGETLEAGEILGLVGSTGRVTGPHLHWSLYVGGVPVDPLSMLELTLPPSR